MRTVIISVVGISSLFLVVLIQTKINEKTWQEDQLEDALSSSMSETLEEVALKGSYGIDNRNEMMAAFLQMMLRKFDRDIDLTVKIHEINYSLGQMDIEAIGVYQTAEGKKCRSTVRRNIRIS